MPGESYSGHEKVVFEHLIGYNAKAFLKALAGPKTKTLLLQSISIAAACDNTGLATLDISNCSLEDSDAQGLAEIIKRSHTITKVNARGNQIGNVGAQFLLDAITSNPRLTDVDLEDNLVNDAGLNSLRDALNQ